MIPQALIDFIHDNATEQVFKKGETIIQQGGTLEHLYLIEKGYVSLYDIDRFGNSRMAAIFPATQIFPISWLLNEPHSETAKYYYDAISNVRCLRIRRDSVHKFLNDRPLLYKELADMMAKGFLNAVGRIYNLQKSNINERIDFVLNFFAVAYGNITDGIAEVDAVFTHQKIADFAGLSRESVSRQLAKERYKKIFQKRDDTLYINLSLLKVDTAHPIFSARHIEKD